VSGIADTIIAYGLALAKVCCIVVRPCSIQKIYPI